MAILQTGEFVLQRRAVSALGTRTLEALNDTAPLAAPAGRTTVIHNNITIQANGPVDDSVARHRGDLIHEQLLKKRRAGTLGLN